MTKKCWFLALIALGLMGCSDNDDSSSSKSCEDQGKVTCNGQCYDACADGASRDANCECTTTPTTQTCEEQGKVTCNGLCYDACADGASRDANCACPTTPATQTCEEQGKVTCNGQCYDACADGASRDANCECPTTPATQTCEEQGKVTCNGQCYDACADGASRDANCECPKAKCQSNVDCNSTPATPICDLDSGECKASTCGDGIVFTPEVCDPMLESSYNTKSCADVDSSRNWQEGGVPGCDETTCQLALGSCLEVVPEKCGNGVVDEGEQCDIGVDKTNGTQDDVLNDATCTTYDDKTYWKNGGKPACSATCTLDVGTCEVDLCGNGDLDGDEKCDFGRDENGKIISEKTCGEYSASYLSGNATKVVCKNNCSELDVSSCLANTQEGVYWCQLMTDKIEFNDKTTSSSVVAYYATGSDVTELDAELVLGTKEGFNKDMAGFKTIQKTISRSEINSNHALKTDLLVGDLNETSPMYYTYRVRKSGDSNWKYCQLNVDDAATINGDLPFCNPEDTASQNCNEHRLGTAEIVNVPVDDRIAVFDFSSGNSSYTSLYKKAYPADSGLSQATAKISAPDEKNVQCNNQSKGGCFTNGADVMLSAQGWSTQLNDSVNKNKFLLIEGLNIAGASNLNIQFVAKRNNKTGSPNHLAIYYSTDNADYTLLNDVDLGSDTEEKSYGSYAFPSTLNSASNLYIRLVPYGGSGFLRLDDIIISKGN